MRNPPPRYDPGVRRLQRVGFDTITALSVLLCAAMVALWIRSISVHDEVSREHIAQNVWRSCTITSNRGIVRLRFNQYPRMTVNKSTVLWRYETEPARHEDGVSWGTSTRPEQSVQWMTIPHGYIAAMLAMLPIV